MPEVLQLISVYIIGLLAGFVGTMVGSGGLLSIPFLIFLGIPPTAAIATNKAGAIGLAIGALAKFLRGNHIQWRLVLPYTFIAVAGSVLGALVLLEFDETLLSRIIGIIILLLLPLVIWKKELGTKQHTTTPKKRIIGYALLFCASVWGGFFGGGAATLAIYILVIFFGLTFIDIAATIRIPGVVADIITLGIFLANDLVIFDFAVVIFLGMTTGGFLGARTMIKKGNEWVRRLFFIVVAAVALKLLI